MEEPKRRNLEFMFSNKSKLKKMLLGKDLEDTQKKWKKNTNCG